MIDALSQAIQSAAGAGAFALAALFVAGALAGAVGLAFWRKSVTAKRLGEVLDHLHDHIGHVVITFGVAVVLLRSVALPASEWVASLGDLGWILLAAGAALGANQAGLGLHKKYK